MPPVYSEAPLGVVLSIEAHISRVIAYVHIVARISVILSITVYPNAYMCVPHRVITGGHKEKRARLESFMAHDGDSLSRYPSRLL